jgi:hypothetical protein
MAQHQGKISSRVCETIKELELPWTSSKGVVNRRGGKYVWREKSLVGRTRPDMDRVRYFTWNFTASSTNCHCVENVFVWTYNECCDVGCELHSISWDTIVAALIFFFVWNCCWIWGRLVAYRSPIAESWDSVEPFFSFEARNINVHEWERQSCDWT